MEKQNNTKRVVIEYVAKINFKVGDHFNLLTEVSHDGSSTWGTE